MTKAFISSALTSSLVPSVISYETLDNWVRGYGTDEERAKLALLVEEIRAKIEKESGLRIGEREVVIKTDHYPHNEIIDVYPVKVVNKIEIWLQGSTVYEDLNSELYTLERKDEKMNVIIFSDNLPSLEKRETAVKITLTAGCTNFVSIPALAMAAIRTYVETYFRDKMPAEVKSANEAIDRCINNLRLWL